MTNSNDLCARCRTPEHLRTGDEREAWINVDDGEYINCARCNPGGAFINYGFDVARIINYGGFGRYVAARYENTMSPREVAILQHQTRCDVEHNAERARNGWE